MKIIVPLVLGILINQSASAAGPDDSSQPLKQGGQRAYIDPNTGQLTSSPPPQQTLETLPLSLEEQNAMSTSHEGLSEQEIPGKGIKLDLQGRFQSSTFATIDDSGQVSISHGADDLGENRPLSRVQGDKQKQGE